MDRLVNVPTVIASLFALSLAVPAGAIEKCKAKVDRKTGAIRYSFKYSSEGPVQFAYASYGLPSTHAEDEDLYGFANEDSCQRSGKGKGCRVSTVPDLAAIAPANCKAYLYDTADDTFCEARVPGCQPAMRPLPTSGYYAIKNNHETTAVWDAATGMAWHISSDHQPRPLDGHHEHLKHLNGTHVDPTDTAHTPLVHGGNLQLPTLHQLKVLAQDCADLLDEIGGIAGTPTSAQQALHTLCTELWRLDGQSGVSDCVWSATRDATQPTTHAYVVCLTGSSPSNTLVNRSNHTTNVGAYVTPVEEPWGTSTNQHWYLINDCQSAMDISDLLETVDEQATADGHQPSLCQCLDGVWTCGSGQ